MDGKTAMHNTAETQASIAVLDQISGDCEGSKNKASALGLGADKLSQDF